MLRFLLVAALSLHCHTVLAGVTFQQAKQVFARLQNKAGVHAILKLDKSLEVNAYASPYAVYINQGMLNSCNNEGQLAMVLGHELAHFKHRHGAKKKSTSNELLADREGYYYCKGIGYNNCISLLKKMRKIKGEQGRDGIHPSWSDRINRIKSYG